VAASRDSSFAPFGPRNRSLPNPSMRLRWANSISTFLRSFIEISYCLVLAPLVHVNMHCRAVDVACNLTGVFVLFAGEFARV